MAEENQNEFNSRMLKEMRQDMAAALETTVGHFTLLHKEIVDVHSETLMIRNEMFTSFKTQEENFKQHIEHLRHDVRLMHGYLAETSLRMQDHEERLQRLEKAVGVPVNANP